MKTCRFFAFIGALLVCACVQKQPTIPMTEVPAGPMLQSLEKRQQSFQGLKAVASVEIRKWGGKRILENVGVVLDGQRRLRLEAYGPLGQTIMALVWDGRKTDLRLPETDKTAQQAQMGITDLLAEGLDMQEICAALSGNIPELVRPYDAAQFCNRNNDCQLEIHSANSMRRVQLAYAISGSAWKSQPASESLFRSGELVYQTRFSKMEVVSQYSIPMRIEIEIPNRKLMIAIEYHDVEVNTQISDEAFTLSDE